MPDKICQNCNISKSHTEFAKYRKFCKKCYSLQYKEYRKNYYRKNKLKCDQLKKRWAADNRDSVSAKRKIYYQNNRQKLSTMQKDRKKKRLLEDVAFKIKCNVSRQIHNSLTKRKSSKNNFSFLSFVQYSILELRIHLESLFEPWMSWSNYGRFNSKTWIDDDSSTWTWQIDHIIPKSEFIFTKMCDEQFKLCWSLNNLRPYSSKLNWIDGYTRKRHSK